MTEIKTPVVARLAATLLLVRDTPRFEVMMVKRAAEQHYASALVFPGGHVDASDHAEAWTTQTGGGAALTRDERALRIAGFRELFEETGALCGAPDPSVEAGAGGAFSEALAVRGLRLDLDALHPFGHWVTPQSAPKRYDTHFFLCGLDAVGDIAFNAAETTALEWLTPQEAVEHRAAGTRRILFPTLMNLKRLAESGGVAEAIAAARARPVITVSPRMSKRPDGLYVHLPEEAGYGPDAEDRIGDLPAPA